MTIQIKSVVLNGLSPKGLGRFFKSYNICDWLILKMALDMKNGYLHRIHKGWNYGLYGTDFQYRSKWCRVVSQDQVCQNASQDQSMPNCLAGPKVCQTASQDQKYAKRSRRTKGGGTLTRDFQRVRKCTDWHHGFEKDRLDLANTVIIYEPWIFRLILRNIPWNSLLTVSNFRHKILGKNL